MNLQDKICVLCRRIVNKSEERYLVEGRGQFDCLGELRSLPFEVDLSKTAYICKGCQQNLRKRCGLKGQLDTVEENLKTKTRDQPSDGELCSCVVCICGIPNAAERYLVQGRNGRKADILVELQTLPFILHSASKYICKKCLANVNKRKSIRSKIAQLEEGLSKGYGERATRDRDDTGTTSPSKRRRLDSEATPVTSTPKKAQASDITLSWPVSPLATRTEEKTEQKETTVVVQVHWPSKDGERKLTKDLESLGKMLVRGTYKQIANAAWKNPALRKELIDLMLKDVQNEMSKLCSKREPSCLRKTDKSSMESFTMEKLDGELQTRAPLFHSFLTAACVNSKSRSKLPKANFGAVGMAAAVCLRNRSKNMIAVQLLVTTFLYHSNWVATLARLGPLRLTTSHTYLYKKLDEYGKGYDKGIRDAIKQQSHLMASEKIQEGITTTNTSAQGAVCTEESLTATQGRNSFDGRDKNAALSPAIQDSGRKLTFDNLDYHQDVHYMTEEHQNVDKHYVTYMSTENRVSGCHLSDQQPFGGILEMENGKCLPSSGDNVEQRGNYIALTERVITTHIPCLQSLSDVANQHIPHQYRKEMSTKSDTTFLGMINESENDADGILKILKVLHDYVPYCGEDDAREYGEQGIVGDQLSVERAINGHTSVANGFTPEERMEGMHFEIADWHGGNRFLEAGYCKLFSPASAADKCTLYSDRNLINRRNVKSDVSSAANPCRRFFQLEVEARIIAVAMKLLGISKMEEQPTQNVFQGGANATRQEKKDYLQKLAALIVDTFVINKEVNESVEKAVRAMQLEEEEKALVDENGRYPCRFNGCTKTFAHDGKLRRDHEANHNPPVVISNPNDVHVYDSCKESKQPDDMLNYQKALLDYGMLVMNFMDAISEGDGERVIRCWRFFLMYLKHQGGAATKYSLEALYLMFQVHALLSPREAHRLVWNRFCKNKPGPGGNIPLDLQLEFYNKSVKEAIKKLGPSASVKSINRICHSLGFTTTIMKLYDQSLNVFRRSGKHVRTSQKGDMAKVVNELVANRAFYYTPGRAYRYYQGMRPSLLAGFDMRNMYSWINDHKKNMVLSRRAR